MKKILCLFLFSVNLCAAGGLADGADLLVEKLAGINSFSAQFEQQLLDINGQEIQKSSGVLKATKPNKLYWKTDAPFEQQIIADGETIWLYDPDLLQVTTQGYPEELARTPAMLLIGETAGLDDEYHVYQESFSPEENRFLLIAKNADNLYEKVSLDFSANSPAAMTLFDTLQQQTIIQFTNVKLNGAIDAELFRFVPPVGVDVIRHD